MKKLMFFLLIPMFLLGQFGPIDKSIKGSQGNIFAQDEDSGAMVSIDVQHYWLHEGRDFKAGYQDITVSTNDTISMIFYIPSGATRESHWALTSQSTGAATIQVFENCTVSDSGTAVTRWNRKRASTDTSLTRAYHTPTVTETGTKMAEKWIGGTGFKSDIGGEFRGNAEFILKPGYIYLIYGIGNADNIKLAIGGSWYEPNE